MINNNFEDNGKAILDIEDSTLFSYSFSSDAHIVAENMENYQYANKEQSLLLDNYLEIRKDSEPRELFINTLYKLDRTRTVLYNGIEIKMNNYKCNSCKSYYYMNEIEVSFCPMCGKKVTEIADVSL